MNDHIRYPSCEVQLVGEDGNALAIVGRVAKALNDHLRHEEGMGMAFEEREAIVKEFKAQALSGDYNNVLTTCMEWVTTY